jgi:hypothetical protein
MLRNLFVGDNSTDTDKNAFISYLLSPGTERSKLAGVLALAVIPVSALGWWCYSVVMSVGAMAPLQSANGSSSVAIPKSSFASDTTVNTANVTASLPADPELSDTTVDVKNNAAQTTVEVNGQSVPIAEEGTTHQVIQNDNGQATVDINIDSSSSGRATSRSSTDINIRSSSSSDVDIRSRGTR